MENTVLYLMIAVIYWGGVALMMFSPLRRRQAEQVVRKIKNVGEQTIRVVAHAAGGTAQNGKPQKA
ncbi:MAG: hypothetical protein AB1513_01885 [Pseudomonadota bacterium]